MDAVSVSVRHALLVPQISLSTYDARVVSTSWAYHATGACIPLTCSARLLVAVRAGRVQLASVTKPPIVGSDDHGKQERNHRAGCYRPIMNRLEPVLLRPEPSLQERFGEERGVAGVGRTEFALLAPATAYERDGEIPSEGRVPTIRGIRASASASNVSEAFNARLRVAGPYSTGQCRCFLVSRPGGGPPGELFYSQVQSFPTRL